MKTFQENWMQRIKGRFGPANAVQDLMRRQKAGFDYDAAYMMAKEASEILAHYRREARFAIRTLRLWQARETGAHGPIRERRARALKADAVAKAKRYSEARRAYEELVAFSIAAISARTSANDTGGRHAQ